MFGKWHLGWCWGLGARVPLGPPWMMLSGFRVPSATVARGLVRCGKVGCSSGSASELESLVSRAAADSVDSAQCLSPMSKFLDTRVWGRGRHLAWDTRPPAASSKGPFIPWAHTASL